MEDPKISFPDTDGIEAAHPLEDFGRRVLSNKMIVTGAVILLGIFLLIVFAPILVNFEPDAINVRSRFQPPFGRNFFGTDNYGRDLFSRVVFGAQLSLKIGFFVAVLTTAAGTLIGLVAGYYAYIDNILMRIMDSMMAFPAVLLGIAITTALLPSEISVILALTIVYSPRTARIIRGSVLAVKQNAYVESARAAGASSLRIIFRHILPNCLSPLIVQFSFIFAYAILAEAGLSFVGEIGRAHV